VFSSLALPKTTSMFPARLREPSQRAENASTNYATNILNLSSNSNSQQLPFRGLRRRSSWVYPPFSLLPDQNWGRCMRPSSFPCVKIRCTVGKGPDQHSSAISLRFAYYRHSSVYEARCYETFAFSPYSLLRLTSSPVSRGFLPAKSVTARHS
jgi:hypothetical protein